jgi:hypothetical protein
MASPADRIKARLVTGAAPWSDGKSRLNFLLDARKLSIDVFNSIHVRYNSKIAQMELTQKVVRQS